jgi:hypothetical protein
MQRLAMAGAVLAGTSGLVGVGSPIAAQAVPVAHVSTAHVAANGWLFNGTCENTEVVPGVYCHT